MMHLLLACFRKKVEQMTTYILNTIAFKPQLATKGQKEMIDLAKMLGFDAVEIRNEFLQGETTELAQIADQAKNAKLALYYSVNDTLFVAGKLNPKFPRYLNEMRTLKAKHIKLNLGAFGNLTAVELAELLAPFLDGSFELRLENDQTKANSDLAKTTEFFALITKVQLAHISYCFDIANWSWLDVSVKKAISELNLVTQYLHLKNFKRTANGLVVTGLEAGELDWRALVAQFEAVSELGFEYESDLATLANELNLVKGGDSNVRSSK